MKTKIFTKGTLILIPALLAPGAATATAPSNADEMDGTRLANKIYAVTHGDLFDKAVSKRHGKEIGMVVNRVPLDKRHKGRMPYINTFETYINNKPADPTLDSQQMAIITSGKVKGTGILFTDYVDKSRSGSLTVWLPALRKIRRMNEPSYEDTWVGTNLTYGELVLRRPEDETHELLAEGTFDECLPAMELEPWEINRFTSQLPGPQCEHKGKPIYRLKSTTRFRNWWYDYHISDVDRDTFSVYRTVYFKGDEKVKTVVVDWQSLDQPDPRIKYPRYIYAVTHGNGADSMIFVPRSTVELNGDIPDSFWSEETLKKHGR